MTSAPGTTPSVGSFNDRCNVLKSESPALLYLWEKLKEFKLLDTVLKKLGGDVALEDTVRSGGIPSSSKKKKQQIQETNLRKG